MALTTKGLVDSVGAIETRQYKDKTFVSRTLIIEQPSFDPYTGEKRNSNFIKFEATKQETCDALNNFPVGTKVEIEFIVRGAKYAKKDGNGSDVFTHLELRNIALASAGVGAQATAAAPVSAAAPIPTTAQASAPANAPAAPAAPASDFDPDLGF